MEGDCFNVNMKKGPQEQEEGSGIHFNESKIGLKTSGRRRQNIMGTTAVSNVGVATQDLRVYWQRNGLFCGCWSGDNSGLNLVVWIQSLRFRVRTWTCR